MIFSASTVANAQPLSPSILAIVNNNEHEDRVLYKSVFFSACVLLTSSLCAAEISLGKPVPPLSIENKGELVLKDSKIHYQQWDTKVFSTSQSPRVHTVQYLAARMSASKINEPFTDRIDAADFPTDKHLVTTIINVDDAMWGTTGFVTAELEANKKKHPHASMVADQYGLGAKAWSLSQENSAVMILAPSGEVLFFKQGALSAAELDESIQLIEQQIQLLETQLIANGS